MRMKMEMERSIELSVGPAVLVAGVGRWSSYHMQDSEIPLGAMFHKLRPTLSFFPDVL